MKFLSNGVGVVDSAGGGVIHCTAGTVIIVVSIVARFGSRGRMYSTGESDVRESAAAVTVGTLLFWLGFLMLHASPTHLLQSSARWINERVRFDLHVCMCSVTLQAGWTAGYNSWHFLTYIGVYTLQ